MMKEMNFEQFMELMEMMFGEMMVEPKVEEPTDEEALEALRDDVVELFEKLPIVKAIEEIMKICEDNHIHCDGDELIDICCSMPIHEAIDYIADSLVSAMR